MVNARRKESPVRAEAKALNRQIFVQALQMYNTAHWNEFIRQTNIWIIESLTKSLIYGYAIGKQSLKKELKLSISDRINRLLEGGEEQVLRVRFEADAARWSEPLRKRISNTLAAWAQYSRQEGYTPEFATDSLKTILTAQGYSPTSARNLTNSFSTAYHLGYNGVRYVETRNNPDVWGYRYQTAGDELVRDTHIVQQGTTLPKDDPFWSSWWPPNGYNCRCTATILLEPEKIVEPDRTIFPDRGFISNPFALFIGL